MQQNQLNVRTSRLVGALVIGCALIVAASIAGQLMKFVGGWPFVYGLVPMFNVDAEQNVPTMFSIFLLLLATALLMLIAVLKGREGSPYTSRWRLLAAGFLYMAFDEGARLHELFILPMRQLLGERELGIFFFAWVIPFGLLVLLLAVYFARFVFSLPRRTAVNFVIAAVLFVGGALGMELVGGYYAELYGEDLTYTGIATAEETMEMSGVILYIYALLQYIGEYYPSVGLRFPPRTAQAPEPDRTTGVTAAARQ